MGKWHPPRMESNIRCMCCMCHLTCAGSVTCAWVVHSRHAKHIMGMLWACCTYERLALYTLQGRVTFPVNVACMWGLPYARCVRAIVDALPCAGVVSNSECAVFMHCMVCMHGLCVSMHGLCTCIVCTHRLCVLCAPACLKCVAYNANELV